MQLEDIIRAAGIGQLLLAAASLAIPRVLGWKEELARLRPLTRQVFIIYSSYILGTNVAFGLLSTIAPRALLDARGLAPRGAAGRLWTLVCLVGPLPLCFHAPFIRGVVLPLALGSPGS